MKKSLYCVVAAMYLMPVFCGSFQNRMLNGNSHTIVGVFPKRYAITLDPENPAQCSGIPQVLWELFILSVQTGSTETSVLDEEATKEETKLDIWAAGCHMSRKLNNCSETVCFSRSDL